MMVKSILVLSVLYLSCGCLWSQKPKSIQVYTYSSQHSENDVVNSFWFETGAGIVLIDVQRLIPEVEKLLQEVKRTSD